MPVKLYTIQIHCRLNISKTVSLKECLIPVPPFSDCQKLTPDTVGIAGVTFGWEFALLCFVCCCVARSFDCCLSCVFYLSSLSFCSFTKIASHWFVKKSKFVMSKGGLGQWEVIYGV